jgi:hypothetical protein
LDDGTECVFDVYEAVLVWDGNMLIIPFAKRRLCRIDEADSEPFIGMLLMAGYQLTVQVFEGGHVELILVGW